MSSVLMVLGLVALLAWGVGFGGRLPKVYRARACQGRLWREAYPTATKQEIRDFLSLFVGAFAFDDSEKLKLAPTDEILHLYRARYAHPLQADAMEIETLALELERRYGVKLEPLWTDTLTLGQLFAHVQGRPGGPTAC